MMTPLVATRAALVFSNVSYSLPVFEHTPRDSNNQATRQVPATAEADRKDNTRFGWLCTIQN